MVCRCTRSSEHDRVGRNTLLRVLVGFVSLAVMEAKDFYVQCLEIDACRNGGSQPPSHWKGLAVGLDAQGICSG